MRTSEVARGAGVNATKLRYWEAHGLIPAPPRTSNGYRDYPVASVAALRFVMRAQGLGFTLAEIEQLLQLAGGGPESCDTARHLAATHITGLNRRIAELERMRDSLDTLVSTCDHPRHERSCPLLEALGNDEILDEEEQ